LSDDDFAAYCPKCVTFKLKYCLGDSFVCTNCNRSWFTHQVLDKNGFLLLERCPTHGLETGGHRFGENLEKYCLKCGLRLKKIKRLFPDDLDLGDDIIALDFTNAESLLRQVRTIFYKLPPKTFEAMPRRWHEIFVDGIDDLQELSSIALSQGKVTRQ